MGRVLIFSELFEIRELLAQDFAAEGHTVVVTGNPALTQTLLTDLNPDLVLLDLHLKKASAWNVHHLITRKSPQLHVLPFAAYPTTDGNFQLTLARPEGGENLSFQAFKQKMNILLNPNLTSEKGESEEQRLYPES